MDNYRLLLEQAARLYEKYEAGRPQPFNIFSVLRRENDEVNLHSRFLHALLDYKKPGHETKENLADFLRHVGVGDFEQHGVKVERESAYIDILITNDAGQAIAIENKIEAKDQPKQLCRYYNTLKNRGYSNIHLLYLTLYGADPSEASFCGPNCEARSHYEAISYKDTLPDWLERCQQRACDELGLRESVAQYRQLVQKLTGTDFEGAYMNELTELVLEGDNLVLVHDLNEEAMIQAKIHLLQQLWCEVDIALKEEIADLPPIGETDKTIGRNHASEERIRHFFTGTKNLYHGLFYPFGSEAALAVEAGHGDGLIFGVHCYNQMYNQMHGQLRNATLNIQGGRSNDYWPWYRYADGNLNLKTATRDDLRRLSSNADRKDYAQGIARDLKPVWDTIKKAGLAS